MSAANEAYPRRTGSAFPPVLDACCGGRHFWFDKKDGRALFVDKRRETIVWGGKQRPGRCDTVIDPDQLADFTNLPFPSDTFALVVWDPPHGFFGKTGIMAKTYGRLDDDWQGMLTTEFIAHMPDDVELTDKEKGSVSGFFKQHIMAYIGE